MAASSSYAHSKFRVKNIFYLFWSHPLIIILVPTLGANIFFWQKYIYLCIYTDIYTLAHICTEDYLHSPQQIFFKNLLNHSTNMYV